MTMRPWLAPLAAGLLACGLGACGGSSDRAPASTSAVAGTRGGVYDTQDGDNDPDDRRAPGFVNDEESLFPTYGRGASPADARTIASLVKRYLAAAAAGDGATACSLLDATLLRELGEAGDERGDEAECAKILPSLFERERPRLSAADVATMTVISVHVKGRLGLAELGFRTLPEQELIAEREGREWKIDAPLGNFMP